MTDPMGTHLLAVVNHPARLERTDRGRRSLTFGGQCKCRSGSAGRPYRRIGRRRCDLGYGGTFAVSEPARPPSPKTFPRAPSPDERSAQRSTECPPLRCARTRPQTGAPRGPPFGAWLRKSGASRPAFDLAGTATRGLGQKDSAGRNHREHCSTRPTTLPVEGVGPPFAGRAPAKSSGNWRPRRRGQRWPREAGPVGKVRRRTPPFPCAEAATGSGIGPVADRAR